MFHENNRKRQLSRYAITFLAEFWRQDGHRVHHLFGIRKFVPADLLLVHVDLSVAPDEYLEFADRYPIALNGGVKDIRKSLVSTNLVKSGDPHSGKVIVKSDLNYGAFPERMLKGIYRLGGAVASSLRSRSRGRRLRSSRSRAARPHL